MSQPLLSLCMIVRDERELLPRCLASARRFVDETVIVDTGSSDGTPELAAGAGARVIRRPWDDDFSAARNAALDAAQGTFVLVLDADEWIEGPADSATLRDRLGDSAAEAFTVEVVDRLDGGREGRYPLVRLFRNRPDYRYEGTFHEQITPSIARRAGVSDVAAPASGLRVGHDGYLAERREERGKAERNLEYLRRRVRDDPGDAVGRYFLARERVPLRGGRAVPGRHLDEALEHLAWIDAWPGRLPSRLDVDAARVHAAALLARGEPREALDLLERRGDGSVGCELLRADADDTLADGAEVSLARIERCIDRDDRGKGPFHDPGLAGPIARARAAEILTRLGRIREAEVLAAEATAMPGGGATPWTVRARVARAAGRTMEALRHGLHAVEVDRHDPWAWLGLGTLLLELGRQHEAAVPLRTAAMLAPGWAEAEQALSRVGPQVGPAAGGSAS